MWSFFPPHLTSSQAILQVKMDKASNQMIASTVGWLGFYKCDHIKFGLMNASATFHRLVETCLGDLQSIGVSSI